MSFYGVFINDFQMATGLVGPTYDKDQQRWENPNSPNGAKFRGYDHHVQVLWFSRCLKDLLKRGGFPLEVRLQRPHSSALLNWQSCSRIRWSESRRLIVDGWLKTHLPSGVARRRGAPTKFLPLVTANEEMRIDIPRPPEHGIRVYFPPAR